MQVSYKYKGDNKVKTEYNGSFLANKPHDLRLVDFQI